MNKIIITVITAVDPAHTHLDPTHICSVLCFGHRRSQWADDQPVNESVSWIYEHRVYRVHIYLNIYRWTRSQHLRTFIEMK